MGDRRLLLLVLVLVLVFPHFPFLFCVSLSFLNSKAQPLSKDSSASNSPLLLEKRFLEKRSLF